MKKKQEQREIPIMESKVQKKSGIFFYKQKSTKPTQWSSKAQ